MKFILGTLLLTSFLLSCDGLPSQENLAKMTLEERWSYLEEGQSLDNVHHLLGKPTRTLFKGTVQLDQYDCALCITKTDKNRGLLAWNMPIKGFEEEAALFQISEKITTNQTSPSRLSQQEIQQGLDKLLSHLDGFKGGKPSVLLQEINKHVFVDFLTPLLAKSTGNDVQEIIAAQQKLLQQIINENEDELIRLLECVMEINNSGGEQNNSNNESTENRETTENDESTEEQQLVPALNSQENSREKQWASIREGLNEEEVIAILGQPRSKKMFSGSMIYKYECFTCQVFFDENGRVWAWHSPSF